MTILVLNSGGSSLKAALFDEQVLERLLDVRVNEIGGPNTFLCLDTHSSRVSAKDHGQALGLIFDAISTADHTLKKITAVGHRVVHGGEVLTEPTVINDEVEQIIDCMTELAPLHNQACLAGIRAARKMLAHSAHVAIFDTGFHSTLPTRAKLYALPEQLSSKYKFRRFGFHGISHEYVSHLAAKTLKKPIRQLRIISCHLGNGCSVTAVDGGRSVETSMGMTPLEGLVMGSRCGDLDPGVIIKLMRDHVDSANELDILLNRKSGLFGMTGCSDMREIEERAAKGDESCRRAIQVFTHRARKYVGAYAAAMGGVDAILFTGGIGENSALIRHRIAQRFDFLGATLDEDKNRDAVVNLESPVADISDTSSLAKIFVIASNEEKAIARSTAQALTRTTKTLQLPQIPIAVSARHVHLNDATLEALFGTGYTLKVNKPLSQPHQFSAQETVTIVGPGNQIDDVRILGPTRSKNQIEISRSDEFFLGVDAPVRASGDTDNTPGITLLGPAGKVTLRNGVICALRHIHMHPDDALIYHVKDGDLVNVAVDSSERDLIFGDVLIRVNDQFRLEMHIDTDEANAAGLKQYAKATLARTEHSAQIASNEIIR